MEIHHKLNKLQSKLFEIVMIFYEFIIKFSSRNLSQKLHELKERIQNAVVNRVVEDFIDITTPLKQFTDAVLTPEGNLITNFLFFYKTIF